MDNRKNYIITTQGSLGNNHDSLESIISSVNVSANGVGIDVDITQDGIAVLCRDGYFMGTNGEKIHVGATDSTDITKQFKKLIMIGQAIDLAKSCGQIISITPRNIKSDAMIKLALKHADYTHKSFLMIEDAASAIEVCKKYKEINIITYLSEKPKDMREFMFQMKLSGLFGFYAKPNLITRDICIEAKLAGLFIATTNISSAQDISDMLAAGVNFIHTDNPVLALEITQNGI